MHVALTRHAHERSTAWGVPPGIVGIILEFGTSSPARYGARKHALRTTASLWDADSARVHFTSALRYPVFVDGNNWSGTPNAVTTPLLRDQLLAHFTGEMRRLPSAIYVPLGPKVSEAVTFVAGRIGNAGRVLSGLPHPSGANAERIAFFLGRKDPALLSTKVNAQKLIAARASIVAAVSRLGDGA